MKLAKRKEDRSYDANQKRMKVHNEMFRRLREEILCPENDKIFRDADGKINHYKAKKRGKEIGRDDLKINCFSWQSLLWDRFKSKNEDLFLTNSNNNTAAAAPAATMLQEHNCDADDDNYPMEQKKELTGVLEDGPVLYPDFFHTSVVGRQDPNKPYPEPVCVQTEEQAKELYNWLHDQWKSNRNRRGQIDGAFYKNLLPGFYLLDARKSVINVTLELQDGTKTRIVIHSAAKETALLQSAVSLGNKISSVTSCGNARSKSGDFGDMYALGLRNPENDVLYSPTTLVGDEMNDCANKVGEYLLSTQPDVLREIQTAEEQRYPGKRIPQMDTHNQEAFIGNTMMVSKDLGNTRHKDIYDKSRCWSLFVSRLGRDVDNWYLVFPDARIGNSKGVVVKLFHGCNVSWDGLVNPHLSSCSAVTLDPNDAVYGVWYGSTSRT